LCSWQVKSGQSDAGIRFPGHRLPRVFRSRQRDFQITFCLPSRSVGP
jgi:hypothetical protein